MPDPRVPLPSTQTVPVTNFVGSIAAGGQPSQNPDTFALSTTPPEQAPFGATKISPSQVDFMRTTMRAVVANGGSQQDAMRWMEIEGQASANLAPNFKPLDPTKPPEIAEAEEISMINGLGRRVLQGISFGFGDEALGSILGIASGIGARGGIDQYRAELEAWSEQHKGLGFTAEAIGALATGFGVARGAGALFGRGLNALEGARKASVGSSILAGGAVAGAEGALAGAGFAEGDLSERAKAAIFGAGIGVILGGSLAGVGRLLSGPGSTVTQQAADAFPSERVRGMLQRAPGVSNPMQNAEELFIGRILEDGATIPAMRKRLVDDFISTGTPVSIVDLSGEGTMAFVAATLGFRTPPRQAAVEALRTRQADQGGRLAGDMFSRIFRGSKFGMQTADDVIYTLEKEMKDLSRPLYRQADELSVTVTPRMRQLFEEFPEFRRGWDHIARVTHQEDVAHQAVQGLKVPNLPARTVGGVASDFGTPSPELAARIAAAGGGAGAGFPATLPVRGFNRLKQLLDDDIQALGTPDEPVSNLSRKSLGMVLGEVLKEIDTQVPVYGQARLVWSSRIRNVEAVQIGVELGKKTPSPGAVRAAMAKLPPNDRDFLRLGYMQSTYDKMSASPQAASKFFGGRLFGSIEPPEAQAIRALFPVAPGVADDFLRRAGVEARVTESTLRTRVAQGARSQSFQAVEAGGEGKILSVRASAGLTVAGGLRDALERSKGGFVNASADEIAVMVMQGLDDPSDLMHLLDVLQSAQERLIRSNRVGSVTAAAAGFTAGRGAGSVQANLQDR